MHELQEKYYAAIEELAAISTQVGRLGYVASHGGNLSMRVAENVILITPTKTPKENIIFDDIVIVDSTGRVIFASPGRKPTGETPMHTHLYHLRPDLKSIIHAHPPVLTGFAMTDSEILSRPLLPEPILELGPILAVPYAEPVSNALAQSFDTAVQYSNAWLMRNHGFTLGSSEGVERTWGLFRMAEAMADSVRTAMIAGTLREIPREEVLKLEKVLVARGLPFPGNPAMVRSLEFLYFKD